MKRILALLLALSMLFALTACGGDNKNTPTGESTGTTTNTTENTSDPTDGTEDGTQSTAESTTGGETTETTEPPTTVPPTTTPPTTTPPTTTPPTTTPPTTTPPTTTPPTTTPPTTTPAETNSTESTKGEETNKTEKTIAVIAKGETHAFWKAVKAGAEKAAAEKGYKLTFQGPVSEGPAYVPSQIAMVRAALSNNVDGIVLATIGSGFSQVLTQAYDQKIPIVTFDSGVMASDIIEGKNPIVAHVATSNKAAANISGEKLFEAVKEEIAKATAEAPYVIGIIQHDETATGVDRAAGFEEKFKELADADETTKGKYKIEKEVKPGDANQAYKEALEALYEKGVKAVFMSNEGVVKQVYDAAKSAEGKYDGIIFTGFDAGTKQLTWIKENATPKLFGSVAQDSIEMGYQAALQCIAAVEGGEAKDVAIAGAWYNAENLITMLDFNLIYTDAAEDAEALRK